MQEKNDDTAIITKIQEDSWHTVEQLSESTGGRVAPWVIRGMIGRGELKARRLGRKKLLIHGADALALPGLQALTGAMGGLLTVEQAAKVLRVSCRTLSRWRSAGTGPAHVTAGGASRVIWYPREGLTDYLERGNISMGHTQEVGHVGA